MTRIQYIPSRVIDSNGIADGAQVFVYQSGTTTKVPLFSDSGFTVPITNPLIVPSGAEIPVFYTSHSGLLRLRVVESNGTTSTDDDPYSAPAGLIDLAEVRNEIVPLKEAPVTNKFITNLDGANINRMGDRVFVGGANANSGNFPNDDPDEQDWYTQYEREQGRPNGIIVSSQMAVLTNDYFGAAIGGIFAAQTKHFISGVGGAIGLEAHVVNNNTVTMHDAWALYSEATRDSEGVGAIITYEADARNKGLYHAITPYNQHPKQSVVHQVASGGALDGTGCEDVSAGINFRDNPTKFGAGIVFGNNSIRGTDGSTGYGNAILSALGHRHTWVNPAGERTGWITATATTTGAASGIEFSELGMLVLGPSDTALARIRSVINAVNYLDITPGVSGQAVQIGVASAEANAGLFLSAKGTGAIIMSPDAVRNYADDAAAASGGIPVGGIYHVAGDVRIRIA